MVNTYVLFLLLAVITNIPPVCENKADNNSNNKKYVWSDEETKVFQDLIQRTSQQF